MRLMPADFARFQSKIIAAGAVFFLYVLPLFSFGQNDRSALQLPNPADLVGLRVLPQNPELWGGKAAQRLIVLGQYADGIERDVTAACRFSISDPSRAEVEASGRVTALSDGQ